MLQDINYQHEPQGAVSQTPILDELREAWYLTKKQNARKIPRLNISESDFMAELRAHGCIVIAERGDDYSFEYDDDVKTIAHQLWLYTIGSKDFAGSLSKGIALVGYFGCGKSLIMESYARFINYRIDHSQMRMPKYDFLTSSKLFNKVRQDGIEPFAVGAMIIDEIGRESKVAKVWGNESLPVVDVLFERHRRGVITHMTANFTLEDLKCDDMYGEMLGDRFEEMFNFIVMNGGIRRKQIRFNTKA